MDFMDRYNLWLNMDCIDAETKKELISIKNDKKEIEERFYKNLDFGTGGIRGILGAGDNRMNIYTVGKATQGLSNYIKNNSDDGCKRGVVIAYDPRHMSPEFAKCAALTFAGNGIKAYLFDSLRPTPELSFAIRELGCIAGVVVTASHNPPEYNGYKVYWEDGAQIAYPVDEAIINEVNSVPNYEVIIKMNEKEALDKGLLNIIGSDIDEKFYKNVLGQILDKDLINEMSDKLSIVYTPIHGTGNIPVREVLKKAGFNNLHIVKEQELPDSNFTTVGYPNPEDPKVFNLAKKLGEEVNADLIVGTDPDADRVGAVVKNEKGEYVVLSGNMTGSLLVEYILSYKNKNNELNKHDAIISTIVSTELTKKICKNYDVNYFETLTGFKYIGEKIKIFKRENSFNFLFGFEESYGCLAGTYARDKDAVVATLLLSEMAAYYKKRGMTLYDGVVEMYEKYGYFADGIESMTLKGKEGSEKIESILKSIRSNPFKVVLDKKVIEFRDYKSGEIKNFLSNNVSQTDVPSSNVLYFVLEDESWFCIRPSGTEPKIKIYFGVKDKSFELADKKLKDIISAVMFEFNKLV